ncbi:MAG: glucosamine-6-phosphate deaminase [Eubacteriales bacterium]|nr:glucosamine-6-phosphate deaminase [Eubacteriales bacterium]
MQVFVYKNEAEVGKAAGMIVASEILKKPDCILGLATGSTPIPTYQEMIRMNKEGILDFSKVRSFNLDEYIGLSPEHVCSYRRFMNEQLFDHINIDKANTHVPDGLKCNAAEYEEMIHQAGGVDLQLLGIGTDGHIGFNEPADEFVYPTNVVKLTEGTRKDNARFFNSLDEVPTSAISMGIGTIMSARRILMIITGKNKADTVVAALKGPVMPQMPASILRMHQNVLVLLDEDAASKL